MPSHEMPTLVPVHVVHANNSRIRSVNYTTLRLRNGPAPHTCCHATTHRSESSGGEHTHIHDASKLAPGARRPTSVHRLERAHAPYHVHRHKRTNTPRLVRTAPDTCHRHLDASKGRLRDGRGYQSPHLKLSARTGRRSAQRARQCPSSSGRAPSSAAAASRTRRSSSSR